MESLAGKVAALQSFPFPTSFARGLSTSRLVYSGTVYILAMKAEFSLARVTLPGKWLVCFCCVVMVISRSV